MKWAARTAGRLKHQRKLRRLVMRELAIPVNAKRFSSSSSSWISLLEKLANSARRLCSTNRGRRVLLAGPDVSGAFGLNSSSLMALVLLITSPLRPFGPSIP